jgi:RNA methyltransferase, TrmH family
VKELRASLSSGSISERGLVGIEGEHLLIEAIRSGIEIATIFVRSGDEAVLDRLGPNAKGDVIELPPDIFASAVTTESPQGIAALVKPRTFALEDALRGERPMVAIAAGLQDPGNLGTLIRSAEAFGASGIITLSGTVTQWNAKAMRASSGSVFRLPVMATDEEELFSRLQSSGIRTFAGVAEEGVAAPECNLAGPVALFIGNEGRGLSPEILRRTDERITIPCIGPVESLNAAIAGSILLYEASRQRRTHKN